MLQELREAFDLVAERVAALDVSCLDGRQARALMEEFARGHRLTGAGVALMARRVDETGAFNRSRHRSAAHYLAKVSGTSVFAAEQTIRTARQVAELPATETKLRAGELSAVQVKEVAAAAAADPAAEGRLLERAGTDGIKGLKAEAARVIAAASPDENERYARMLRERSLRHWRDHDGAGRIDVRGPLDLTTRVVVAMEAHERELFDQARTSGEPVRNDALMFDALVAMADASDGTRKPSTGPRATVMVRVDQRAFLAGDTEPGEVCEIVGVGPIPVSVARRLADDAFLKAIMTNGVDVLAVSHLGRTIPAHLRSALDELYPQCAIAGCNITWGLEIDHNMEWAEGGPTALWNLNKLCQWHHDLKTRQHLRLTGHGTDQHLVPAAEWTPPNERGSPRAGPLAAA